MEETSTEPFFGKIKPSASGLGKWLGYIDKFFLFPLDLRQAVEWADVVHICDHSNAVYTKYLQNVPHLVTCNDLLAICCGNNRSHNVFPLLNTENSLLHRGRGKWEEKNWEIFNFFAEDSGGGRGFPSKPDQVEC